VRTHRSGGLRASAPLGPLTRLDSVLSDAVALKGTDLEAFCIDATACLAEACVTFSIGEGSDLKG